MKVKQRDATSPIREPVPDNERLANGTVLRVEPADCDGRQHHPRDNQ